MIFHRQTKPWGWALGLFLLALAVRLPLLITQRDAYLSGGITTSLGLVARNILEGRGLVEAAESAKMLDLYNRQMGEGRLIDIEEVPELTDHPTKPLIQRMPGYPLLLASIWKVTGSYRYLPIQILQVLLSSLLPFLIWGAGSHLFGRVAGLTAGVLTALNLPEARLAVVPLYDWWIIFLTGFLIWFVSRSSGRGFPFMDFMVVGLVVAVGVYFKATMLAIPVFLAMALIPRLSGPRALVRGAVALAIPLLALVPWVVRNDQVFNRPILTNTFFWASIWEGFGEVPNDFGAVLDDRATYLQVMAFNPRLVYGSPEYDEYFRPKVLQAASSSPEFLASLWARRTVRGLLFPDNPWGIPAAEDPERSLNYFREKTGKSVAAYLIQEPIAGMVKLAKRVWAPLLFILAMLTLFVDRHRWRDFLPMLALAVSFLAVTIPIHLEGRYLLPTSLVWILFAGAPLSVWLTSWRMPTSGASAPASTRP